MARVKKDIADMYKSPFSVALRELMSEKPVTTQEKLAEITGKTRQTVSQYVNGISEPGYDTLVKIADYFHVSTDYLLGRTKDKRIIKTMYDKIDISEDCLTALRLASAVARDPDKLDPGKLKEFADFYFNPEWDIEKNPGLYAPGEIESIERHRRLAKRLCDVLPVITEMIISAMLEQGFEELSLPLAQLVYPELYPSPEKDVMDEHGFVDFKIYQITKGLSQWMALHFNQSI